MQMFVLGLGEYNFTDESGKNRHGASMEAVGPDAIGKPTEPKKNDQDCIVCGARPLSYELDLRALGSVPSLPALCECSIEQKRGAGGKAKLVVTSIVPASGKAAKAA